MTVLDNEELKVEKLEIEIENTRHITNTYIIKNKKENTALVIDPAFNEKRILESLAEYTLEKVVVTHSHADHIAALAKLVENVNTKVYIHKLDFEGLYKKELNEEEIVGTKVLPVNKEKVICVEDGEKITLGDLGFKVIHTPGHTSGSIVLYNEKNDILFAGDTIFESSYGRTDLVTGSKEQMGKSLDKLFSMLENTTVFSGHGRDFNLSDSKRKIRLLFAFKG